MSTLKCYGCGGLGHFGIVVTRIGVPICLRTKVIKLHHGTGVKPRGPLLTHAPGSKTATIEAGSSSSSHPPEDPVTALSDEQLEEILRTRRCQREQSMLNTPDSHVSTVTASGAPTAIGPT